MSLTVKSPRTHEMVRELADLLGVSKAQAVSLAVEDRLAREHQAVEQREAAIRSTVSEIRRHILPRGKPEDVEAGLYDDDCLFA